MPNGAFAQNAEGGGADAASADEVADQDGAADEYGFLHCLHDDNEFLDFAAEVLGVAGGHGLGIPCPFDDEGNAEAPIDEALVTNAEASAAAVDEEQEEAATIDELVAASVVDPAGFVYTSLVPHSTLLGGGAAQDMARHEAAGATGRRDALPHA